MQSQLFIRVDNSRAPKNISLTTRLSVAPWLMIYVSLSAHKKAQTHGCGQPNNATELGNGLPVCSEAEW